jgi:acetyltransferase-like isoleucine patch superfamily enzyme
MKKMIAFLAGSFPAQAIVTLFVYAFYAVVIGVSLIPSVYLLWYTWNTCMSNLSAAHVTLFSLSCGAAIFLYFITGALVMSIVIRVFTLGIKPGRYPMLSLTMIRWMIYSGVYHLAGMTILAYLPMSVIGIIFFRIIGARIGKNVRLNTWFLNDAYLLEIGDNVIIGGKTDISCHTFEKNNLILQRVKIGAGTFIGQRCYISPGVTIGKHCLIGQYALVRKNNTIPDRSIISAIGGLPIREVMKIEKFEEYNSDRPATTP